MKETEDNTKIAELSEQLSKQKLQNQEKVKETNAL